MTLRESRRAEKWCGNERYRDVSEYGRGAKQDGTQKKDANGVSERLCSSDHIHAKGLSKSSRKSVERHLKGEGSSKASIASHALMPTETPMRPLCSGQHVSVLGLLLLLFEFGRSKGEGDGLSTKQTNPWTA